jgi:hypothetical protein
VLQDWKHRRRRRPRRRRRRHGRRSGVLGFTFFSFSFVFWLVGLGREIVHPSPSWSSNRGVTGLTKVACSPKTPEIRNNGNSEFNTFSDSKYSLRLEI